MQQSKIQNNKFENYQYVMNLCLILYHFEQYLNILLIIKSIKCISDIHQKLYKIELAYFELQKLDNCSYSFFFIFFIII